VYAALMLRQGKPMEYVQAQLGHAKIDMRFSFTPTSSPAGTDTTPRTSLPGSRPTRSIREVPNLRIVPESLWQAAHARIDRTRQTYHGFPGVKGDPRPGQLNSAVKEEFDEADREREIRGLQGPPDHMRRGRLSVVGAVPGLPAPVAALGPPPPGACRAPSSQLLAISARQIDRRLAPHKRQSQKEVYGRTKPGTFFKHHIPPCTDKPPRTS